MSTNNPYRLALATALALVIGAVSAASPHYVKGPTASVAGDGTLTVSWKQAGLGNGGGDIEYAVTAHAEARYQCVNRGGRCPAASNKQNVVADLGAVGEFPPGKNGQITAYLEVAPPLPTLNCPGRQVSQLVSIAWTGIVLNELTTPILDTDVAPPDPISRFECP